jgi:hypothetical protein
VKNYSGT